MQVILSQGFPIAEVRLQTWPGIPKDPIRNLKSAILNHLSKIASATGDPKPD
jgi:hypothetical protein